MGTGRPYQARPGAALVLAVFSFAVVCWVSVTEPEAVKLTPEQILTQVQGDDDVMERALSQIHHMIENGDLEVSTPKKPIVKGVAVQPGQLHENIVDLKAFCVATQDNLENVLGEKTSSIVPFVKAFGKDAKSKNVVLEYAKTYSDLSEHYNRGFGGYLLKHMNDALLAHKGVVGFYKNKRTLDFEILGLEEIPHYFKTIKVHPSAFLAAKSQVEKLNSHADTFAAAELMRGKHNWEYTSFLAREIAKVNKAREDRMKGIVAAANGAAVETFDGLLKKYPKREQKKLIKVKDQAQPASDAADAYAANTPWKEPSMDELRQRAQAKADEYMKKLRASFVATDDVVKKAEKEFLGVILSFRTATWSGAESAQQPTVIVKGTKNNLEAKIEAVGEVGQKISQTFESQHPLGDIKSITLKADPSADDAWGVVDFAAQHGEAGEKFKLQQTNFWLQGEGSADKVEHQGHPHSGEWELTRDA